MPTGHIEVSEDGDTMAGLLARHGAKGTLSLLANVLARKPNGQLTAKILLTMIGDHEVPATKTSGALEISAMPPRDAEELQKVAVMEQRMFPQEEGGIWEEREWTLSHNHIHGNHTENCTHSEIYSDGTVITPWVVVSMNEGGYNSTGVCAECIGEALSEANTRLLAETAVAPKATDF